MIYVGEDGWKLRDEPSTILDFERSPTGEVVRYESSAQPLSTPDGPLAESIRRDTPFACFGNQLEWYPGLRAIQRLDDDGHEILVVRTGDTSAAASTLFIEADSGRVRRLSAFPFMAGLGRVGVKTSFGDFRDVSGMLLPFRTELQVAHPFIGSIEVTVSEVEVAVQLPPGGFALAD